MSGILDDELFPKKGKEVAVPKRTIIGDRATVARTIKHTPEVVVKIVSNCKDSKGLSGMIAYISRTDAASINGGVLPVEIEDERGNKLVGVESRKDVVASWKGIPKYNGKRREAFHIVWSMPTGTDPEAVKDSVRRVAAVEFQRFQYVFGKHEDTEQVHVHLVVHTTPFKGKKRLSPGRRDLVRWRESFAENLREHHGIEANATPRAARFETKYAKSSNQLQSEMRKSESRDVSRTRTAATIDRGKARPRVMQAYKEYMDLTVELNKGSETDRKMAKDINLYVHTQAQRTMERGREL